MAKQHHDNGFTLVEVLLVVLILSMLATIVVFSVGGVTSDAREHTCSADARTLATAAEAYFAQTGNRTLAGSGADADRYEQTLVEGGFLRDVSSWYDLDTDGRLLGASESPCVI